MAANRTTARTGARATSGSRPYASPLRAKRAEETRAAITRAATARFIAHGWTSTGMRDVARDAGVAVETLYKHFPSKRRLFDTVIDEAVVGDAEPIPVAGRPEFLAMGEGPRAERIAAAAAVATATNARTAPFAKLIREAAATDREIAGVLRATRERQRSDVATGLTLVLGREPTAEERDGAWAIVSPEVYLLLTEASAWPAEAYERWLAEALGRLLPGD